MKNIWLSIVLLASSLPVLAQSSQNDFVITGKIKGKDKGFVYLNYAGEAGKYKQDSVPVKNGLFVFKGTLAEPSVASLLGMAKIQNMDDPNFTQIFIEPGSMKIDVQYGAFKDLVMTGSKTEAENRELAKLKEPIRLEMKPIVEAYMKEKDHEKAAEIREQFEPYNNRMDKIDLEWFRSHPDSYITAYMMRFKISSLSAAEAENIYNSWTARIKQSAYGKDIAEEIKKLKTGSPGSVAPGFTSTDINGIPLSLSDFKGKKYVMLDFWASWCVPCRKGNPHLIALYNKYKNQGFEIIGVASDDTKPEAWRKAVDQDQIGIWKHVLSGLKRTATGYDRSSAIGEAYGIHTLPTKILIDKDGVIIGRYGGGGEDDEAMDKKLTELFGTSSTEQKLKPFTLKGQIKGQDKGVLRMAYVSSDENHKQDSAAILNGTFEFKGLIAGPKMVYFSSNVKNRSDDDPNATNFFIEPGMMTLALTANDFKNFKLSGSITQDAYTQQEQSKAAIRKATAPISLAYKKANDVYRQAIKDKKSEIVLDALKEKASAIRDQFEPFNEQESKLDSEFIKLHPDSYYSAYLLQYKISSMSLAESLASYQSLSEEIKNSEYGKAILKEIKALQGGSPGSVAAVFNVKDINGEQLNLADFKGKKYVLLDFWASWCVPCRKGNPHLLSLYSKYKDKGLEIVGISDDDSKPEAWRKAVAQDKIGVWKHVLRGLKINGHSFDRSADISEPFGIHSLPTKILIDKDGVIIGRYGGGGENDDAMDKKLGEIFN
jgi:thiol-disulfide isomerase/thioredoxin